MHEKLAKVLEIKPTPEPGAQAAKMLTNIDLSAGLNVLHKKLTGSGIMLTNNEIKDIVKVINYLENGGIFLKGTTKKITGEKVGFINFLGPLKTDLPLMTNSRINGSSVSERTSYSKGNLI